MKISWFLLNDNSDKFEKKIQRNLETRWEKYEMWLQNLMNDLQLFLIYITIPKNFLCLSQN